MRVPSRGSRGQGWVYLQFALMAAVVAAGLGGWGWPEQVKGAFVVAGALLAAFGAVLAAWSAWTLGRSLTPFPAPPSGAALVEAGPYARLRHPVYAAGIVVFLGAALLTGPWGLLPAVGLAFTWALKLRVEERFLRERFPEYAAYCERVPSRLLPGVY